MTSAIRGKSLELTTLTSILILAAYLRLAHVAANPGWYTDEGTHLDIARHLLNGRVQYLAINQSWLLFSRLPLFEVVLAVLAHFVGVSMEALRGLTGALGVITVAVLYFVVRRISHNRVLALLAALLLAIYPPAVLYSRFGFSYNLLAPLMLVALLGMWEYTATRSSTALRSAQNVLRRRWLALAALSIGLGTISDIWAFVLLTPLVLVVLSCNWRDLFWSVPLALLPCALYATFMQLTVPQAFLFDARFVLSRLNPPAFDQQLKTLGQNIMTLAGQDVWMILGAIGLWMLRPARWRWQTLAFFLIPIVVLGRTTALFSLSYYYLIPLLPFVALGVASLIRYGTPWVTSCFPRRYAALIVVGMVLLISWPFVASSLALFDQVRAGFKTSIDPFLVNSTDAERVVNYLNVRTGATDLVIASPALAWALDAQVADMQMPIAYSGQATPHLPADVPADRWAFKPDDHRARYVVVDNLWRNWAAPNVPGVVEMLTEVEKWPLVFKAGEIEVYQNPAR